MIVIDVFSIICLSFHVVTLFVRGDINFEFSGLLH